MFRKAGNVVHVQSPELLSYLHVLKVSDSQSWQVTAVYINQFFACDEVLSEACL